MKSGIFTTNILQYYRYRGQSIILDNHLQNGSSREEHLLKPAFCGQGERRMRVGEGDAVTPRDVAIHGASAWGPSPGTSFTSPNSRHPQIPQDVNQTGKVERRLRGREGQLRGGDSVPRLSCVRVCVTSRISQSPCFSSAAVTRE